MMNLLSKGQDSNQEKWRAFRNEALTALMDFEEDEFENSAAELITLLVIAYGKIASSQDN